MKQEIKEEINKFKLLSFYNTKETLSENNFKLIKEGVGAPGETTFFKNLLKAIEDWKSALPKGFKSETYLPNDINMQKVPTSGNIISRTARTWDEVINALKGDDPNYVLENYGSLMKSLMKAQGIGLEIKQLASTYIAYTQKFVVQMIGKTKDEFKNKMRSIGYRDENMLEHMWEVFSSDVRQLDDATIENFKNSAPSNTITGKNGKKYIVLRGVMKEIWEFLKKCAKGISKLFYKWCLSSKTRAIICTATGLTIYLYRQFFNEEVDAVISEDESKAILGENLQNEKKIQKKNLNEQTNTEPKYGDWITDSKKIYKLMGQENFLEPVTADDLKSIINIIAYKYSPFPSAGRELLKQYKSIGTLHYELESDINHLIDLGKGQDFMNRKNFLKKLLKNINDNIPKTFGKETQPKVDDTEKNKKEEEAKKKQEDFKKKEEELKKREDELNKRDSESGKKDSKRKPDNSSSNKIQQPETPTSQPIRTPELPPVTQQEPKKEEPKPFYPKSSEGSILSPDWNR